MGETLVIKLSVHKISAVDLRKMCGMWEERGCEGLWVQRVWVRGYEGVRVSRSTMHSPRCLPQRGGGGF